MIEDTGGATSGEADQLALFLSVPGGEGLVRWAQAKGWPQFHDAALVDLTFAANAACTLRLRWWPFGHPSSSRIVAFRFAREATIEPADTFEPGENMVMDLRLAAMPDGSHAIAVDTAYGPGFTLRGRALDILLESD